MCSSTSTASCRINRKFVRPNSPMCLSNAPTPGKCTSIAKKSSSERNCAMVAVVSPMPKPISKMRGRVVPVALSISTLANVAAQLNGWAVKGTKNCGPKSSSARCWPAVKRPARSTKDRIRSVRSACPTELVWPTCVGFVSTECNGAIAYVFAKRALK
jgi:hypothetical protein